MDNNQQNSNCSSKNPNCYICKQLIRDLRCLFEMLGDSAKNPQNHWLTVEDIAKELKISKSIVYNLIRNGKLKAVNIVNNEKKISLKGHYRIKRQWLDEYIKSQTVKTTENNSRLHTNKNHFPKVKNHLGL